MNKRTGRESIEEVSKSLMPIGLVLLKKLLKADLIKIILNREISFNELREEYLKGLKQDFKNSFNYARINLGLTYTQEQLIEKNVALAAALDRYKRKPKEDDKDERR